jgi:hypothetical protein
MITRHLRFYTGTSIIFSLLNFCGGLGFAQKPIVTDEFDRFLVTQNTEIGEVIGQIGLIEPNPKPVRWTLIKPIPGGDRRNYLEKGQLDATEIVEIDHKTAEIRLKKRPSVVPADYYAEVRATNEDGWMEQVLIIIVKEEKPKVENALDIFTQRREAGGMMFYATEAVETEKIDYAANVANALYHRGLGAGPISGNNIGYTVAVDITHRGGQRAGQRFVKHHLALFVEQLDPGGVLHKDVALFVAGQIGDVHAQGALSRDAPQRAGFVLLAAGEAAKGNRCGDCHHQNH